MKWSLFFVLISVVFPIFANNFPCILNQYDLEMQNLDREEGAALFSENKSWITYNQWQCFNIDYISLNCTEYDYGKNQVPTIIVNNPSFRYEFDLHVEDGFDCRETLVTWAELMNGSREVCIYASFMPGVREVGYPSKWFLWYIQRIKTSNGYWSLK